MKVFFVINSSNNGGAPKMIVTLYQEMKKKIPESEIIFLKKIESQYSQIAGARYLSNRLNTPVDYIKVFRKLYNILKKEKPDATISFLPLANIFSNVIGKHLGIPIRIASQRNPPYIYGKIVRVIDRYIGANGYYTHNICNSVAGMKAFYDYPESYKKLLDVIRNCVEPADFSISKESAVNKLNLPKDKLILTCVGRLHDQKNHDVLIKTMQYLENTVLYLAGDGPLRENIISLIKDFNVGDKVVLLGDLNREDIRLLLRATDIFVIPSKYEGLSNSLIEAMSYGLPVICSDIPSFTNFLKIEGTDSYAGIIVESNDEKDWSYAIESLKEDVNLIEHYQTLSLDKVKDLTAEKMTNKYINLLK
ncbi:glycosyltransferase [Zunongwangia pacifica]|uniref:Glycosyltransferase n=1 Tax=Zunongwangia pacifica TaxID=2911062 RepID=A0A9X1ZP72_9FLAO|nr:glycosyltransferase [Zunongwangia pacifica]MCL6216760.1 glycosyltransferase [Zunongwangia pacifica]